MTADDIRSRWVTLTPGFEARLSLPPAGRGPGLLLFQEIFGVNAHIQAVADQYALAGFVVLAPDLFWRQAPREQLGYEGADRQRAMELMQAYAPADAGADILAAVQALRARPEVQGHGVGAIGYCMGGRLAFVAAATTGLDAAVAYYGGGIQNQLHHAAAIRCPVQFHYAGHDDHIPPQAVDAVEQAMAGRGAEFYRYADASHGFNCWSRAAYHPASAGLAHGRSLVFLSRTLWHS